MLIAAGIIISITLTKLFANTVMEMLITLISGWFVWGYGLVLRVKIRNAIRKLQQ